MVSVRSSCARVDITSWKRCRACTPLHFIADVSYSEQEQTHPSRSYRQYYLNVPRSGSRLLNPATKSRPGSWPGKYGEGDFLLLSHARVVDHQQDCQSLDSPVLVALRACTFVLDSWMFIPGCCPKWTLPSQPNLVPGADIPHQHLEFHALFTQTVCTWLTRVLLWYA